MTNSENLTRQILIVSSNKNIATELSSDPLVKQFPLLIAQDGTNAQTFLANKNVVLAGVFVSPKISNPHWISVLKCSHSLRPSTPLYLILDESAEAKALGEIDLKRLGIKQTVVMPKNYRQMVELVAPIALSFDSQAALLKARNNTDTLGAETTGDDFIPIRAEDFLSGAVSFFDVYAKLGARYLKLLNAGDSFPIERLENYLLKGARYFYIKKEVQEDYLNYCDHIASSLLKAGTISSEIKVSQTLNHGEEVMKYLTAQGVSDSNLKYAAKFASNVGELARQIDKSQSSLMSDFMNNMAAYDHGTGTAMLAGMLANALQIGAEKPVQIVGLAALFHDMGLANLPDCIDEDPSKMNPEQLKQFLNHPLVAAAELAKLKTIHPSAIQAIEQHHMRLSGQGFPKRTGTTIVSKVAEIIGICDELNRLTKAAVANPNLNILVELEEKVFPLFSRHLVLTFKSVFYPNVYNSEGQTKSA